MKSMLLSLTLATSLAFVGCGGKHETVDHQPQQQQAVVSQTEGSAKTGSHLCGATTKAGKPCTRKVSDENGKDAKCFQHRG